MWRGAKVSKSINVEVRINLEGGIFGKNWYITAIKEEWREEKSKKSINVEGGNVCGGWNFFSKSISVTPRLLERWE